MTLREIRIDKQEIFKLTSILLDQGLASVLTFFTTIVLSRIWSLNDYADFVLLLSVTLTILGFQRALVSQPYVINLNDFSGQKFKEYFYSNIWHKVIFTFFILFILIIVMLFNPFKIKVGLMLPFTLFILGYTSFFYLKDVLLGQRKTALNLKYSLLVNLFLTGILLYIFFLENKNVNFYFITITIVYTSCFIIFCYKNRGFYRLKIEKISYYFKLNWIVGKWIAGSNLFFTISSQVYPWLLLWFMSKNEVAMYGVLISVSSLVSPFIISVKSYLLPIFTKYVKDKDYLLSLVRKWMIIFFVLSLILILIGFFGGDRIIEIFFGSKFSGLGIIVILPFIDQAINLFFQPLDIALNAVKRTDIGFWLLIFRSIIALSLGYCLVQEFGLIGVFITRIIENLLYQIAVLLCYNKIIR